MTNRLYYKADLEREGADNYEPIEEGMGSPHEQVPWEEANLIGSECDDGQHMPVLDIDAIPCHLIESSTPGHYHLLIDKPMSWIDYKLLLKTLAAVGIIEKNYKKASIANGRSHVRKPGTFREVPRDPEPEAKIMYGRRKDDHGLVMWDGFKVAKESFAGLSLGAL